MKYKEIPEVKPWLAHYDPGVPESIAYPPVTIHGLFNSVVERLPNNIAIIFKDRKISYQELSGSIKNLAAQFIDHGLKKGERVVLILPNSPHFVAAFYSILMAGGVVTAINPNYTPDEIAAQVKLNQIQVPGWIGDQPSNL